MKACYAVRKLDDTRLWRTLWHAWVTHPSGLQHLHVILDFTDGWPYRAPKPKLLGNHRVSGMSDCGRIMEGASGQLKRKCRRCLFLRGRLALKRRVKCPKDEG